MSTLSSQFEFWTPQPGDSIEVGAERHAFLLPLVPLPIRAARLSADRPDSALVGESLYDYLRQYPECLHNQAYAELLRDAFPHYIADLASLALMLRGKDVAGPYLGRMITSLKILALLEPDNLDLQLQLGISCFDRALMFEELPDSRRHLLDAMARFQRVCRLDTGNLSAHSYLGQVDYLFGDYPAARQHWQQVAAGLPAEADHGLLQEKLLLLEGASLPDSPLIDALEAIGSAMVCAAEQDWAQALVFVESALSHPWLLMDFASPQLHYLQGLCQRHAGHFDTAESAFRQALELDAEFAPALEELGMNHFKGV